MAQKSVLFVCLGNICRSPIAEAVFTDLVKKKGVADQWIINSAGIREWHVGKKPDSRGRQCLASHDIQTDHRGQQVRKPDFSKYDFILGMDEENMSDLHDLAPADSKAKLALLGSYDPKGQKIIEDPYYGGDDGFEEVFQQCVRCCTAFLEQNS